MATLSDLDLPDVDGLTVALDTETSGLFVDPGDKGNARVSIVTLAWYASGVLGEGPIEERCYAFDQGALDKTDLPKSIQAGLFDGDAPNRPEADWHVMCGWLRRQWLVFHNAKFDLTIMDKGHRKWGGGVDLSNRTIWDTQVLNPFFFPGKPTGLKPTAVRLWGDTEDATQKKLASWLKTHGYRFDLAPWDLVAPYATEDATKTIRLMAHQLEMVECGELLVPWRVLDREIDVAIGLFRMEQRGVPFDADACREAAILLAKHRDKIRRDLTLAWGYKPTPAAARRWFGVESADQDHVAELVAKQVPWAKEYQQMASYESALSKWYESWPAMCGTDGRLRPNYRQSKESGEQGKGGGVVSGRLSVDRVQLHAIPHNFRHDLPEGVPSVRSFFRAPEGKKLWEIDIAQAEVRVAADIAICEPLREVLEAGDDVHGQTCTKVFGLSPDHPEFAKYRTLAKRLTFATLYAAGPKTFRQTMISEAGVVVSVAQCKDWLDDYRAAFPQLGQLQRICERACENRGFVQLKTGRIRWFSDFERKYKPYKAMNQLIQGSVAEAMRIIRVQVELHHPGILLHEVHDSIMLEVEDSAAGRLKVYEVELLMLEILSRLHGGWSQYHKVPWAVDAKPWEAA